MYLPITKTETDSTEGMRIALAQNLKGNVFKHHNSNSLQNYDVASKDNHIQVVCYDQKRILRLKCWLSLWIKLHIDNK